MPRRFLTSIERETLSKYRQRAARLFRKGEIENGKYNELCSLMEKAGVNLEVFESLPHEIRKRINPLSYVV